MPRAFRESESKVIRRKSTRALALLLLGTTALVALPAAVQAQTKDWTGANSDVWTDNLNWNPTGQPTSTDQVVVAAPGSDVLVGGGAAAVASQLDVSAAGGQAKVRVDNGSTLTVYDRAVLGGAAGTLGILTVSTGSSALVDNGSLDVGGYGAGALYVVTGGFLSVAANSGSLAAGRDASGSGAIYLDGLGSRIAAGGTAVIGGAGFGYLGITNGGLMEGVNASIGNLAGGTGQAFVDGPGSQWINNGSMFVGSAGSGSLTITNGGLVKGVDGIIGASGSGNGQVTVDGTGSLWQLANVLSVGSLGSSGTGTLSVTNGGTVQSAIGYIGSVNGGSGTATIDGTGSRWDMTGDLYVGGAGPGTLNIVNGGAVKAGGGTIGNLSTDIGAVRVDGAGSSLQNSQALFVGDLGTGSLTISNGGSVTSVDGVIGVNATGKGSVLVSGSGSSWTIIGDLNVGHRGTGTMDVTNGGSVSSNDGVIGSQPGSFGNRVLIDGAGSNWTMSGDLKVGGLGGQGNGSLTIANGGSVQVGDKLIIAVGGSFTGELNIGSGLGNSAAGAGIVNASQVAFGAGTGLLNFNHTETAYDFSVKISGIGTINQAAGTTILSGDSSGFVGQTVVHGGTLAVNGSLGGTLDVLAGGRLQGIGTVGGTTVAGTIAPGNSIGTLNVAGNVTFNPGSIYDVEVNAAGQSDKINATGTATIHGGSVRVLPGMGNHTPATTYTILTANGGRSGTFTEGVTSNFAFLDPSLSYDANSVYLTMTRNNTDFASIGGTFNQRATGGGIESLGSGNPVYNAVLNLSASQAQHAFDQLSGEIHASAKTAMIEDSRFIRNAINDRIRAAFDGVGAARMPVMAYADGGSQLAAADRFAVWSHAFGSWGHWNSDGNAARLDRSIGGFFIGADAPAFDGWRFGAVAGYSRSTFDVKDRHSSGSSDNYHVGLYGGTTWGHLAFRSGAAYTRHDITTNRSVAFPGFGDGLEADYNAGTAQVFGELGYGFRAGSVAFEPFANLAYVNLRTGGYTERGGAAGLSSTGATTDATFTTLGLRASNDFTLGSTDTTIKGTLGWRHAFDDVTPPAAMAFAGGSPFTIAGVPIARDAAVVEAGFDFALTPAATLGVSYAGQFGSDLADQSVKAAFNMRF
jgi:subtilase-type serine protease